ncbi:MAG: hypothetical protein IKX23_07830 [Treponema sp.]|nr:hypothetical protein [Treponema sp.]
MKKGFIIFYSIFISLVFAGSLGYFGYNTFIEYKTGEERTEKRFKAFNSKVVNIIQSETDYNAIRRRINDAVGDTNDFSNIVIVLNEKNIYAYPVSIYGSTEKESKLIKDKRETTQTDAGLLYIYASLYTLRPVSIYNNGKISFFIILIATLLTIIMIVISNHVKKESAVHKSVEESKIKLPDYDDESFEIESTPEENPDDIFDEEERKDEKLNLPSDEIKPMKIDTGKTAVNEGLFSPDTGFGWKSYLETRLENELNRCTASEIDLSLFMINIKDIEENKNLLSKVCRHISTSFQFKDLLFEYKKDTFAAIKIDTDVNEALNFAEELVKEIDRICGNKVCTIGISARSIRMISAERLLKEAVEALAHTSLESETQVIAFRADVTKYRKYIEELN